MTSSTQASTSFIGQVQAGVQAGWVRRSVSPVNLFIASVDFSIAFLVDMASGGSAKP